MKLMDKETGEIGKIAKTKTNDEEIEIITDTKVYLYKSLSEVCQHWEDYEEPKEYWFIDYDGGIIPFSRMKETATDRMMKQIGNYFDSREEAEKAVKKLKAWKRLRDKGFRFTGINDDEDSQELITQCGILCEADIYHLEKDADFLLIFGGEE